MQLNRLVAAAYLLIPPASLRAQSAVVPKTNPMKVYMHMMPWFQTPQTLGGSNWGWHWTMNSRNPNVIDSNGQREIASNYYPLIGTYDSTDPNVIENQMLLMKMSGVDGVIVDWYGQKGTNGDINSLLTASNTITTKAASYGLSFAACLEDRFAGSTSDVTANINYLRQNYFTNPAYIRAGSSNSPLLPVFGPVQFQQPSQWNTIMAASPGEKINLLPLWYQSQQVGSNANGEFSWIYEDAGTNNHLTHQQNFLTLQAPHLNSVMGVAYPGFNDYYKQGGTSTVIPFNPIPSNNGQTLASVLAVDSTYSSSMNMLQLATWNDYGEGTMFEPTVQTGFNYLEQIQKFTGVSYGLSQLQMVYQLFEERTANSGNSTAQGVLNQASSYLNQLDFTDARTALNQYQTVTWNGAGGNTRWSSSANWAGSNVVATNSMVFAGFQGLAATNDFPAQTQFDGFTFAAGAGAFVLGGNSVNLYGDITNNGTNVQSVGLSLALQQNTNINTASGDIIISGVISDGLNGASALTKLGSHVLTLWGNNLYTGVTNISNGTLTIGPTGSLASTSITVAAGAFLNVNGTLPRAADISVSGNLIFGTNPAHGILNRSLASVSLKGGGTIAIAATAASANRTLLVINALNVSGTTDAWQGLFDLTNNDLIVRGSSAGIISNQIKQAYSGGNWRGTGGITSSSAASGPGFLMSIGYETGGISFDSVGTTSADMLLKYTYYGDANLDGKVDGSDYSRIDNGFLMQLTGWFNGDFNYDGKVDGSDYTLIDNAFNSQGAQLTTENAVTTSAIAGTASAVPEPAGVGLVMAGSVGLLGRKRRMRNKWCR